MTNLIGTYKYASNEIKGFSLSTLAKGEKDDCFVRAVAAATNVTYDVAHAYVKDFFGRQDKRGTNFVSDNGAIQDTRKCSYLGIKGRPSKRWCGFCHSGFKLARDKC